MTTSSQRLVDLHRLSSLDEVTKPSWANGINGAGSNSRGGLESNQRSTAAYSMNPPAAPEVPRGPPLSYRNTSAKENALPQRSFSQRAKGRPFAKEAFAENGQVEDHEKNGVSSPMEDPSNVYEEELAPTNRQDRTRPLHVDTDVRRGKSIRQTPRSHVAAAQSPQLAQKPQSQSRDVRRASETAPRSDEPMSAPQRSSTMQYPANMTEEQRREWAPDRSPLQKLEVTLNDISKEEKRARVEEAEMLLRESKAGRGGRRISRDVTSPAVQPPARQASINKSAEPANIDEGGLVRGLSSKQRDRLHHSATVDSRKPDVRRLSGEGRRGFEYQEQEYNRDQARPDVDDSPTSPRQLQSRRRVENPKTRPVQDQPHPQRYDTENSPFSADLAQPSREQRALRQSSGSTRDQSTSEQIKQSAQYAMATRNNNQYSRDRRSLPANVDYPPEQRAQRNAPVAQNPNTQNVARMVPTNITRAVSLQKALPPFPDEEDVTRSGPMKEANSSHKAALVGVAAAGTAPLAAAAVSRTNSRKSQKAPPNDRGPPRQENDWGKLADSARQLREAAPRPVPVDQPQVQKSAFSDHGSENTKVEVFQRGKPRQVDVQKSASQRAPEPIGLGLHDGPAIPPTSHQHQHHLSDVLQHKPRRQSVSFKEPLGLGRPVDEWRDAGVARLSLADQALDSSTDAEKDKAWWENQDGSANRRRSRRSSGTRSVPATNGDPIDDRHTEFKPPLYLRCGPLLRYTGMKRVRSDQAGAVQPVEEQRAVHVDRETWRGSVLIVTQDSQSSYESAPTLRLFSQPKDLLPPPPEQVQELAPEYVDPIAGLTKVSRTGKVLYVRPVDHLDEGKDLSFIEDDNGLYESSPSPLDTNSSSHANTATSNNRTRGIDGESLGKFQEIKGVRLYADPIRDVTFWRFNIEVELGEHQSHIAYRINRGPAVGFWVPARGQSMNIMFHSCNGFSMSVNPDLFSGPDPLWRDVLNTHQTRPFHVMIGGGDQIYNDRVMVQTQHFGAWTQIKNPAEKYRTPFSQEMRDELENFYLQRYAMWFSQGLFAMANSQIPMVNMWDDHDIIDGFGSYPDHFMRNPVFSGLGNIAFKYYMLFQHHSVPEETMKDEPSWLLGAEPGPYINHHSRSVFMHLGKHIAFLGLDCRTERQRDEIITNKTYDLVLERCRNEIIEGETKHLILLLGIPIAYPRLVWLENILTSRVMDPVKALGRAGILKGGFLNKFDGGVEILDDLDDHWTAKSHKHERNDLILDLQDLSAEKSVRITILGGDVHLAAIGQFYSNPKLRVPKDKDHRYMPNIISSAIVNTPPPELMADLLNKRDRVHELNQYTAEDMIPMFTHDVDGKRRNNKRLLPRRNWCSIREYHPGATPPPTPPETPSASESEAEDSPQEKPQRRFSFSRDDVNPRNLFRRISSRGAPPSSYRDDMDYSQTQRPASHDGSRPPQSFGQFTTQSASSTPQRTSFDPNAPFQAQNHGQPSNRRASFDQPPSAISNGPPVRPGNFQRRPTNLSEKAARKGVVPGVDKEGNEVEVNEHINLEGGLDIIINCEVSQKDPAGITTPYRLLVPALWYDGSSDREKLDGPLAEAAAIVRKPTLLKRIGLGGRRRGAKLADGQGNGNLEQEMSETESYSGSEDLQEHEQRPRKRFSLFGRRRRNEKEYEQQEDTPGIAMNRDQQMQEDYARASQQAKEASMPAPGPGFQPQRDRDQQAQQGYANASPQTNEAMMPARGSRSQDQFQYAGGLPPARQLQGGSRIGHGQPRAAFQDKEPRLDNSAQAIGRQPAGSAHQYSDQGGQMGSPSLNETERRGQDQPQIQQYQDPRAQARPFNSGPPPQTSSKLARVLGEQPQYNGPLGFGRDRPPGYDNPNQNNFQPTRSQSQRGSQTYYPPPSGSGAGSNQPYYPPPPTAGVGTRQADGQGQRYSQDDGSGGYGAIAAYKEPKKRRWSLSGGKKWIGDGRIPDA
jgi:hypothetical protein